MVRPPEAAALRLFFARVTSSPRCCDESAAVLEDPRLPIEPRGACTDRPWNFPPVPKIVDYIHSRTQYGGPLDEKDPSWLCSR